MKRQTPMKRKQPRRSWKEAIAKRYAEGECRVCGSPFELESAHTISREKQDQPGENGVLIVGWEATVPLCSAHHREYDARRLDLLPHLSVGEQMEAVRAAGGIMAALRRLTGGQPCLS